MKTNDKSINGLAFLIREDRNSMTRKKYCEITGLNEQTLIRIEQGKKLSPKTIKKCSIILNTSLGDIIDAYNEQF